MELDTGEVDTNGVQPLDPTTHADPADGSISALGLFGSNNLCTPRQLAFSLNKVAAQLCQVYLLNVDPIIKILHRPSLSKWMLQGERYLGYPEGQVSVEALGSAVCYSAATSMTETQCQTMFQAGKSSIVTACRRTCEVAIEKSGLLATRDITVLQAFVLYLVSTHSPWKLITSVKESNEFHNQDCQEIRRQEHRSLDLGRTGRENCEGARPAPGRGRGCRVE